MRLVLMALAIASLLACSEEKKQEPAPAPTAVESAAEAGSAALEAGAAAARAGKQAVGDAASSAATAAGAAAETVKGAGAAAAETAAGAVAGVKSAIGRTTTPPADFPIPLPSDVTGTFTDREARGSRTRRAVFTYTGSPEELAQQYEKAMKAKGLDPEVDETTLGQSKIIAVRAKKGGLEAKAYISTAKTGTTQVAITWREPSKYR
jgi:hypothetical protein